MSFIIHMVEKDGDVIVDEINVILDEIRKIFENDFSGHDVWHSLRVYNVALKIADATFCDKRTMVIASLLHDVDNPKLFFLKE